MDVEPIIAAILASPRYGDLTPEIVANIAAREARKGLSFKETVKAVKNKLHQIAGAYFAQGTDRDLPLAPWLAALAAAESGDRPLIARQIMHAHASMRERLPELEALYHAVFAHLPPIRAVADLACGLHPLAATFMPLATDATYFACDLYPPLLTFLATAGALLGTPITTAPLDLTQQIPPGHYDLAWLLKLVPCLDQVDRGAAARLVDQLDADHLVISFPTRALGGRNVGMSAAYEARMRELLADRSWPVTTIRMANELVFLIDRRAVPRTQIRSRPKE